MTAPVLVAEQGGLTLTATATNQILLFPSLTNIDVGAYSRVEVVYQMRVFDHTTGNPATLSTVIAEMPPVANPLNPSPGDWGNGTTRGNSTISGTGGGGKTAIVRFGHNLGGSPSAQVTNVFCRPLRLTAWTTMTGTVGTPTQNDCTGRIQVWGFSPEDGAIAPPVVSGVIPPSGPILRTQTIAFDVTTTAKVLVLIRYPETEDEEVAWNGDAFLPKFSGSSVSSITGGQHFTLIRKGGWPSSPGLIVEGKVGT